MATVPASRHVLRAKDLIDARYRDPLDVRALARSRTGSPPVSALLDDLARVHHDLAGSISPRP